MCPREVASTGPTDKLSVGMDRHRLAHRQPTAPMSPAGIPQTLTLVGDISLFPGYYSDCPDFL